MYDLFLKEMNKYSLYRLMGMQVNYPFQLTQPIVNGKLFFNLVEHYNTKYIKLFKEDSSVKQFYERNCMYAGHHRIGDKYVRELFKALLLFYHDKFENEDLEKVTLVFYKWAYRLRLKKSRVFYSSIDKYVEEDNLFKTLERSYRPQGVLSKSIYLADKDMKYHIPEVSNLFLAE